MKASPLTIAFFGVGLGLVAGVYLQHRWPVGLWFAPKVPSREPAVLSVSAVASLPAADRFVIVALGQSNAANHGSTRASGGAGVYAFADGKLYPAIDPLPGASGAGGSIWTRLGARLVARNVSKHVVIAAVAQGSTRVSDWVRGGRCHEALHSTLRSLAAAGLEPNCIIWQQGESEAWSAGASGSAYADSLATIVASCRELFPTVPFYVAQSTFGASEVLNEQIRLAHTTQRPAGTAAGPNFDQLDAPFRSDGIHFNDRGLSAAAELWFESLRPLWAHRAAPPAP